MEVLSTNLQICSNDSFSRSYLALLLCFDTTALPLLKFEPCYYETNKLRLDIIFPVGMSSGYQLNIPHLSHLFRTRLIYSTLGKAILNEEPC